MVLEFVEEVQAVGALAQVAADCGIDKGGKANGGVAKVSVCVSNSLCPGPSYMRQS